MIDNYFNIKSIDPMYWGKSGWIFLNTIALTYDVSLKEHYKLLIEQLPYILPCKTCGNNLKKNMYSLDEALESKENFLSWLINIRNEIYIDNNESEKRKTLQTTFSEIFYINSCNDYTKYLYLLSLIFLVIILTIVLVKLINN
jgi:hypothetical protein